MAKTEGGRGRIDRGLRPRAPEDYSNEVDGRRGGNMPPDDMTLNLDLCRVNLIRPRYKEGPLFSLAMPALDPEAPMTRLKPGRRSANPSGQSSWIVRVNAAKYVGIERHSTFLLYPPRDKAAHPTNPWVVFSGAALRAEKAGRFGDGGFKWDADWNKLCKSTAKGGAAISFPQAVWFWQGGCYQNGIKKYMEEEGRTQPFGLAEEDDLTVFQVTDPAGLALMALLDRRRKDYDGPVDDEEGLFAAFRYHAIGRIDYEARKIEGGRVLLIFNPEHTKITKHTSWDGTRPKSGIWGYEAATAPYYAVNATEAGRYYPVIEGDAFDEIFNKAQFWLADEDTGQPGLLRFMSNEEQAEEIARCFASVPKLVQFAGAECAAFDTDAVRAVLHKRVSSVDPRVGQGDNGEDDDDDTPAPHRSRPKDRAVTAAPVQRDLYEERPDEGDEDEDDDAGLSPQAAPAAREELVDFPGQAEDDDEDEDEGDIPDEEDDDDEDDDAPDEAVLAATATAPVVSDDDDGDKPAPPRRRGPKPAAAKTTALKPSPLQQEDDEFFGPDAAALPPPPVVPAPAGGKTRTRAVPAATEAVFEEDEPPATKEARTAEQMEAARAASARSAKRRLPANQTPPAPPAPPAQDSTAARKPGPKKRGGKK